MYYKKAISPVVSIILLLAITIVVGIVVFQLVSSYSQDQLEGTEENQILDDFNIRVVDVNSEQSIIQTSLEELNITQVLLDGFECENNTGIVSGRPLRINLSSCSQNITTNRPKLVIETEDGIIQQDLSSRDLGVTPRNQLGGGVTSVVELSAHPSCHDPNNVGTVGEMDWEGCEDMLIVDRNLLLSAEEIGQDRLISVNGRDFTFGYSEDNIFTGQISNMNNLFQEMSDTFFNNFNADIDYWDVSQVEDLSYMFYRSYDFNQPLNSWVVSNVRNMSHMFYRAWDFNYPLNNWDVSQVEDMSHMFHRAHVFNQSLNNWDVGNVRYMNYMFYLAGDFNQPLNNWDVSNVINMNTLLRGTQFNHPLDLWDVSNVEDFGWMFSFAFDFNQDISMWNVSNARNMQGMFRTADSFNHSIESWNVSQVEDMGQMFHYNRDFNQPLNNWDVSNVRYMTHMFGGSSSFNQPLNLWNVSNVEIMTGIFFNSVFNQDITMWDVSNVESMDFIFFNNNQFNRDLSSWDVNSVTSCNSFDSGASSWVLPRPSFNIAC